MGFENVSVGVLGATGYLGAELLRLLAAHPRVARISASSRRGRGRAVDAVLAHVPLKLLLRTAQEVVAEPLDILFCALPTPAAAELGPSLAARAGRIIDLSGAHRLSDAQAFGEAYGAAHPHPEVLSRFSTGLVELQPRLVQQSVCFAVPGCFATAVLLAVLPLARAGLAQGRVAAVGATGSSGSGAAPGPRTHHPERVENLTPYKMLSHQHAVEVEQVLGGEGFSGAVDFVPVSAPLARGILATCLVDVPPQTGAAQVRRAFEDAYGGSVGIQVEQGSNPSVLAVRGTHHVQVGWALGRPREGSQRLSVCVAIDNLVRGGAGQAVQAMNAAHNWPSSLGLGQGALWP